MNTTDLQNIIVIVSTLLSLPVVGSLAAALFQWFKARLPANRYAQVKTLINDIVSGVEQAHTALLVKQPDRKSAAMNAIKAELDRMHVHYNESVLSLLVESAVGALPKSGYMDEATPPSVLLNVQTSTNAAAGTTTMTTQGSDSPTQTTPTVPAESTAA